MIPRINDDTLQIYDNFLLYFRHYNSSKKKKKACLCNETDDNSPVQHSGERICTFIGHTRALVANSQQAETKKAQENVAIG